jgi:hypothetical protein
MTNEKPTQDALDPADVAIFAVLQDPWALRQNRRKALRAAARLIEDVPKCLDPNPDWEHQTLDERFKTFWAEQDAKRAECDAWGFTGPVEDGPPLPEGTLTFEQAVERRVGGYKTVEGLSNFLKRADFPERFSKRRVVTEFGFAVAQKRIKEPARTADAERKREARRRKREKS